jgi:hypothetical protein
MRRSFSCSPQCFAGYHPDDGQFGLCLFQRLGDGLLGEGLESARATSYFAITAAGMTGTPPFNFSPTLSASTCGISNCLITVAGSNPRTSSKGLVSRAMHRKKNPKRGKA